MLHAAGLALPDGRVIALIGPSGRGKTTASRVLGSSLGYVSDETVAIDDEGRVHPYRKPLSIIEEPAAPKVQRAPSQLGLGALPGAPLQLAAIVLLERRDGVAEPYTERVTFADALEEMVTQSSYLMELPTPLQTVWRHVHEVGGVHRVTYSEAESIVELVTALAVYPQRTTDVNAVVPDWHRRKVPSGGGYVRSALRDAIVVGDGVAVMAEDADGARRAHVISGIGAELIAAAEGVTFDSLVERVLSAHGAPPEGNPTDLVARALEALAGAGIVGRTESSVKTD